MRVEWMIAMVALGCAEAEPSDERELAEELPAGWCSGRGTMYDNGELMQDVLASVVRDEQGREVTASVVTMGLVTFRRSTTYGPYGVEHVVEEQAHPSSNVQNERVHQYAHGPSGEVVSEVRSVASTPSQEHDGSCTLERTFEDGLEVREAERCDFLHTGGWTAWEWTTRHVDGQIVERAHHRWGSEQPEPQLYRSERWSWMPDGVDHRIRFGGMQGERLESSVFMEHDERGRLVREAYVHSGAAEHEPNIEIVTYGWNDADQMLWERRRTRHVVDWVRGGPGDGGVAPVDDPFEGDVSFHTWEYDESGLLVAETSWIDFGAFGESDNETRWAWACR